MKETIKDDLGIMVVVVLAVIILIVAIAGLVSLVNETDARADAKCVSQYGKDWHAVNRDGADCVDNNGNGKFYKY